MSDGPPRHSDEPLVARLLTIPGRSLFLLTLLAWIGVTIAYITDTLPDFPPGRYPLLLWLTPTAVVAALSFWIIALVLERLGVRVYRRNSDQSD